MQYAIIAAGEGSRLAKAGITTPKALLPVAGKPLLLRLLDIFCGCGATKIAVVTRPDFPEVKAAVESYASTIPCNVIVAERNTSGSMESLAEAVSLLEGNKLIATTVDTVFDPRLFERFVKEFSTLDHGECLFGITPFIDDEKPLYIDIDPDTSSVTAFRDTPGGADIYVSGGIYGLSASAVALLPRCLDQGTRRMRDYQRAILAEDIDIKTFIFPKIVDIDRPGDIAVAENFLTSSINPLS